MSDLANGRWFKIESPEQHANLKKYGDPNTKTFWADIQIGEYIGPGQYMLVQYTTGRCGDMVNKVLTPQEVAKEAREQIRELADVLKQALA
jgi:hypothetical protein